jgi:hypothetical protein
MVPQSLWLSPQGYAGKSGGRGMSSFLFYANPQQQFNLDKGTLQERVHKCAMAIDITSYLHYV